MSTKHRLAAGLLWAALFIFAARGSAQTGQGETLSGPDSHETGEGPHGHLFGEWGGERTRLLERGVRFDFEYISDSLWNLKSEQKERLASWNRFRGTVDIDLGTLVDLPGLYFHATALWQAGGILGNYLGLLTSPSGMSSGDTFRLDSWWVEKRWLEQRVTARVGQFAGQDFYGAQHDATSFIFEPMGYALGNLFTDYESFDPPSTPAFEIRVVPMRHIYVKSMVEAEDRRPYTHNPTGLVPQFRGVPVSISEIGFTPGKKASAVRVTVMSANKAARRNRRILLVLQATLLAAFLAAAAALGPFANPDSGTAVFTGMLGVAAMATQNAMVKLALPVPLRRP